MKIFHDIDENQDTHWTHKIVFDVAETVKIMGPIGELGLNVEMDEWVNENTKFREWAKSASYERRIILLVEKRDDFDSFMVEFKLRWL